MILCSIYFKFIYFLRILELVCSCSISLFIFIYKFNMFMQDISLYCIETHAFHLCIRIFCIQHTQNLHAAFAVICVHMLPRALFPNRKEKRTFVMHLRTCNFALVVHMHIPTMHHRPARGLGPPASIVPRHSLADTPVQGFHGCALAEFACRVFL